jgi:pectinesterase
MIHTRYSLAIIPLLLALQASAQQKPIPVDTTYNVGRVYRQIHAAYPEARPAMDSMPPSIQAKRDIVYATLPSTPFGKRSLHLDVFRPKDDKKYPAVIMIHGGGWRSGTRSMQVPMAQMLAAKGFVTIPVEYQLSLEAAYPAAVHNIKAAIRFVKANAKEFGIDTSRIAVSGCSAGGQLAALVGLTNGLPQFEGDQGLAGIPSNVHAIMDIDGVVDFLAPASLNLQRKPDAADVSWLGGTYEEKPAVWKEASPIFWATPSTAVPVLFLNSGFSRFHAGQDELIGMMNEWGIYTEVHKFDVKVHPFWLFHPWVNRTIDHMNGFLRKVFK